MPDFQSSAQLTPEIPGTSIDPAISTVVELTRAMAESRLTATALTRHYLDRIADLNPALHAVITVLPDVAEQAAAVSAVPPDVPEQAAASDAAWRSGRPRGALEGIPILVKDNVQVAGAPTTAGSPALLGGQPPDAFVVSRLRAAGARIPGKANPAEGGGLCS